MATSDSPSFIDKIVDLYQQLQQKLRHISHTHLQSTKDLMGKIDEAHQEDLRQKIREQ